MREINENLILKSGNMTLGNFLEEHSIDMLNYLGINNYLHDREKPSEPEGTSAGASKEAEGASKEPEPKRQRYLKLRF